jgi:uncharacterized protein (TIGR03437 family)
VRLNRFSSALFSLLLLCLAAGSLHAQTTVTLSTSSNSLLGNQTANLQALVTGATNTNVTWGCSVSPSVSGGCAGLGAGSKPTNGISTNTYQAPALINIHATVTITATAFDGTQALVLIALTPTVVTVTVTASTTTPAAGQTVNLTAVVQGTSQTAVTWSSNAAVGVFTPGTGLTATYTAPNPIAASASIKITATLNVDNSISGSATITLDAVAVSISPTSATLSSQQTQQFTATVTNGSKGVTWSISPVVGSIDQTGNYTAPFSITASQKVTVTATSVDDPTKSASATVTLSPAAAVTVSISPSTVSLTAGATQQFTATVTNATTTGVIWSISPATGAAGTIDQTGNYTAPSTITATTATITATSLQDPTKTGTATVTLTTVIGVGSGAPTDFLVSQFQGAFNRGFRSLVSLPPLGLVKVLGAFTPTAYVQEFQDAAKDAGVKYALATGSPTTTGNTSNGTLVTVYQIWGGIYGYYTTLGAATAGLPLSDTQNCPFFGAGNACTYQGFDKNYMLVVYQVALASGTANFYIRNASTTETFNTEWTSLGGFSGAGFPITGESATLTAGIVQGATAGSTYVVQTFSSGAIYAITSGPAKGTTHGVIEPYYDVYMAAGGPSGQYGLPTSEVEVFSSGVSQQVFEGGILQIQPGGGGPVGLLPVGAVSISGASTTSTVTLSLGNSLTLSATPYDINNHVLPNLPVSWASTNGQVIQIQANGQSATVTAVGAGNANVTASSGGKTSAAISFIVTAPCCQVGDGAPVTVQAAFQSAIARNKLSIQTPVAGPAQRVGSGYIQMVQGPGNPPVVYMLAQADQVGTAYVVSGVLLAAYQNMGGPAGSLGYPTSDASAGGTQLFTGGQALAGNPVYLVSVPILTKWALLNYEAGAAGPPAGAAAPFSTFGANSGVTQNFAGGAIYSATAGPLSGQSYFVTGLILATYNAGGGAAGTLGMPKSDEFVTGGVHQQNFEGGTISYTPGSATAQTQLAAKTPAIIVAPTAISAGGTALLAVAGFPNGDTIQVSVTGQASFTVTTASGAYSWSMYIPLTAASQTLSIHAADAKGTSTADGTLVIRGFDNYRVQLSKVQGDSQTGAPGALLAVPLQVALLDASGAAVSGATVLFQASSGMLSAASAVTDSAGHAAVSLRLPPSAGTVGVTASAPNIAQNPVTFYASAAASSLPNFPATQESGSAAVGNGTATIAQKGALLTAVAAILQYHQSRADVPSPNGAASPAALDRFLTGDCTPNGSGGQLCDGYLANSPSGEQIVNLWRAADFTGGLDVVPAAPTMAGVADAVAQGEPVLLSLSLGLNGSAAGGHFVVATGINGDGSIAIQDPSPLFSRTNLNDYLNGFSAGGGAWTGNLLGVVRFIVRSPSATRFLMGAVSQPAALMANLTLNATSTAGACGLPVEMLDTVDASGNPPATGPLVSQFTVCDGLEPVYQLNVGTNQPFQAFVTDLAKNGSSFDLSGSVPAAFQATRPVLNLTLAPISASFNAAGVVNAATFTPGISPGGLFSIFGSGLSGSGSATTVDFDGVAAAILVASPFQINAQVPASVTPGTHVLRVKSAYGTAQQTVSVAAVSPGIFLVGSPPAPAVENQNGSLNAANNPLTRGQALIIYATGLGAVNKQGQFSVTASTVTAVLNGVEMPVSFAGLAPGYTGLYQVNLIVPVAASPGLGISLTLKEAGQLSNTVAVSLQ